MRGKGLADETREYRTRITPAYAGKSTPVQERVPKRQDHPRLCGEKKRLFWLLEHDQGSPPPMRGKGYQRRLMQSVYRITPAYAGKSACALFASTMD